MNHPQLRIYLIFFLLIGSISFAQSQQRILKVHNPKTGQTIKIKENKRVKLITKDGTKMKGKIQILDNEQITLKKKTINLSDIAQIRRSPWIGSALTSGLALYSGATLFGIGVIAGVFGGSQPLLWMIPGAGLIYLGINPLSKTAYVPDNDLQLEVITQ